MATKSADFVITCVKYTADNNQISTVGVRTHDGSSLSVQSIWHRDEVVRKLDQGKTFVTATKNSEGKWTKGASVNAYKTDQGTFIRTDANKIAKDNLGKLPECE